MTDQSESCAIFRKQRYVALAAVLLLALLACGPFGTPSPTLRPPPDTVTPQGTQPAAPVGRVTPEALPTQPPAPTEEGGIAPTVPTSPPLPTEPSVHSFAVCYQDSCLGSTIDYLVVTRPLFVEALTPFINWKSDQGYRVGVVTVDWLAGTYSGRHLAEQMKVGMHDLRQKAAGGGTLYVLLVGDTQVAYDDFSIHAMMASYDLSIDWNVPTGFYRRIYNDPPDTILPSDAYYVEDRDWDPGNTGLNPVPDQSLGQGRFDATLYLGRWSVRDPSEIAPIFAKTRDASPADRILFATDEEFTGGSSCTSWPPTGYTGPNNYASCYVNTEIAQSRLFGSNAPWLVTDSLVVDLTDPSQTEHLIETFLSYPGAVHGSFHGFYYGISLSNVGDGCCGSADLQFRTRFPLLTLSSCSVAAFYTGSQDTIIETVLKYPEGPAVVAQPGHDEYHYYEYLLQGYPVGQAFWRAGSHYAFWMNPIVLFGDPSLTVLQTP
ncbi:MAG: C25 family cysteine peptidase [Anaerolineae bacterium]